MEDVDVETRETVLLKELLRMLATENEGVIPEGAMISPGADTRRSSSSCEKINTSFIFLFQYFCLPAVDPCLILIRLEPRRNPRAGELVLVGLFAGSWTLFFRGFSFERTVSVDLRRLFVSSLLDFSLDGNGGTASLLCSEVPFLLEDKEKRRPPSLPLTDLDLVDRVDFGEVGSSGVGGGTKLERTSVLIEAIRFKFSPACTAACASLIPKLWAR